MPFSYLRKDLYPLDLFNKVGAPLRLSVIYAPVVSALSFSKCSVLLSLVVPRVVLLSVENALSFIRISISYISVALAVIALAYIRVRPCTVGLWILDGFGK